MPSAATMLLGQSYCANSAAAILGSEQVLPWTLLQAVTIAFAMYTISVYTIKVDTKGNMYAKETEQEGRRKEKRKKSTLL